MREESIELGLYAGFKARHHGRQQDRKCQRALAGKGVGLDATRVAELSGLQVVDKVEKNRAELKIVQVNSLKFQMIEI